MRFVCVSCSLRSMENFSAPDMREAFESYIARSLDEEVGRISPYYGERGGGVRVCIRDDRVICMFGLEPAAPGCLELRRMYGTSVLDAVASHR